MVIHFVIPIRPENGREMTNVLIFIAKKQVDYSPAF